MIASRQILTGIIYLALLLVSTQGLTNDRVTERFAQYPGDVDATSGGLDALATQYAVIEGKVTCPYKCVFTGFCFKNVTKTLDLKLQKSWKELNSRVDRVPEMMRREANPIRHETQQAINEIRRFADVFRIPLRGELLEREFFSRLEDTRTVVKNNRDNALALANSLDQRWDHAQNQAKAIVSDGKNARKRMQEKVKADDRCSRGEELALLPVDSVGATLEASLNVQMKAVEKYVRSWSGTLRSLAGVASNTLNQLDGLKESVEPGFTESQWLQIAAESGLEEFLASEKLSRFWLSPCSSLSTCVP